MKKSVSSNWMRLTVSLLFLLLGIIIGLKPVNLLSSWMNFVLITLIINTTINFVFATRESSEESTVWFVVKSVVSTLFFLTLLLNKIFVVISIANLGFLFAIWFNLDTLIAIIQIKEMKQRVNKKWLSLLFFTLLLIGMLLSFILLASPFISRLSVTILLSLSFLILGGRGIIEGLA